MSNKKNGSRKAIPAVDHFELLKNELDKLNAPEALNAIFTISAGAKEVEELYGKISEEMEKEIDDFKALNLMTAAQRNGFNAGFGIGWLCGLRFACGASGPGVTEIVAAIASLRKK